ncbi:SCO4225 family membrane protein [Haloechinothrix halophila]|uniref:SCO4225 family membrane protein n=1 Tax=Haloechinothrix halophila TaxID=1069073 RepID=UPI0005588B39|nr:hypothetical protein [Haloechinothrix halophila]
MRLQPVQLLRNVVARYSRGTPALAIAGGYALIVIGVTVFVVVAGSLKPGSIAAMWLFLATLPSSLVVQFIPAEGIAFVLLLMLGGFVQAWLLWIRLRGKRVLQRQ